VAALVVAAPVVHAPAVAGPDQAAWPRPSAVPDQAARSLRSAVPAVSAAPAAAVSAAPAADGLVRWARVAGGLREPTQVLTAPGSNRVYVTEKGGQVRVVDDGSVRPTPWLNLAPRVRTDGEGGLLSLAFHPDFARTPQFWVTYTALDGDLVLARGSARGASAATARPALTVLLRIPHDDATNHYGGQLVFGTDRRLYLTTGDGGGGGDQYDNARRLTSLLGKVLRLDVLRSCGGRAYCVPSDNPLVGRPGRDELWLWGLRNPWRASVDPRDGSLWIGDVGQGAWEEATRVPVDPRARDLGWPCREGPASFDPTRCEDRPRLGPTVAIPHDTAESITGGFVYRGNAVPALRGAYVAGDFVTTRVWTARPGQRPVLQRQPLGPARFAGASSFGVTPRGELLAVTYDGTLWRLRPTPG
jgi:glucose/arabinose dehydrogenase